MDTKDKETLESLTKELGIALFGTGRGILSREKQDILEVLQQAYYLGASELAVKVNIKFAQKAWQSEHHKAIEAFNDSQNIIDNSLNEIKKIV